ncbi:putative D-xylulose reductase A [Sclerotinia borealis F-4128]|uniref:Putative D-xylulose reductase A n=1 Tax=Sclerotinia borealis (strain F-4128) TaxID=1432307 RepID=W9CGN5_SCLBF|nr:putative D-xylulose reductase A [Sclerotinia borealis F-4128]
MAPKVFITGTTGYAGGDALYKLYNAHPDWKYTALVRNSGRAAPVAAAFPKVRFAYGSLEDASILEEEAAKADIVLHTADSSDHEIATRAIAKGLAKGHTKEKPGYWLHLSGTGILCWKDMETETYGEAPSQEPYDDLEGVSKLTSLPDTAFHRDIDKLVLAAGSESVKTAVVCPPTIYGAGRGPGNQRSRQVYNLVRITLQKGQAPQLGKGLTEWDNVHVHDLSSLWLLLAEAAVAGPGPNDAELWNERGYFLAENGHHVWGEVSKQVGEVAFEKGYIQKKEVAPMNVEEGKELAGFEAISWGLNSKGFAKRARKYLGWKPTGKSLQDEIPLIVESEAKLEGLVPGHAAKASGAA